MVGFFKFLLRFQYLAQHNPGSQILRPILHRLAQMILRVLGLAISQGRTTVRVFLLSLVWNLQIRNAQAIR